MQSNKKTVLSLRLCCSWNGSHIYESAGTEWLNPQGDNVSGLTEKTIFLRRF